MDETYLGDQWKNKRRFVRDQGLNQDEQQNNQYSESSIAMVQSGLRLSMMLEPTHFNLFISKKVSAGSIIGSDIWKAYTGIASRDYVHRLVNHGKKQYSDEKGNYINGLERFWGYLKRNWYQKLVSDERNYHSTQVSAKGDTITKMKIIMLN